MRNVLFLLVLAGIVLAANQTVSAAPQATEKAQIVRAVAPDQRDVDTPPVGGGDNGGSVVDGDCYYYRTGFGCFTRCVRVCPERVEEICGCLYTKVRGCFGRCVYVRVYPCCCNE